MSVQASDRTDGIHPEHRVPYVVVSLPGTVREKMKDEIVRTLARAKRQHVSRTAMVACVLGSLRGIPAAKARNLIRIIDSLTEEVRSLEVTTRIAANFGDKLYADKRLPVARAELDALQGDVEALAQAEDIVGALYTHGFLKDSRVEDGHLTAGDPSVDPLAYALVA